MSNQSTSTLENVEYRILARWPAYRVGTDGSVWSRFRLGPNSHADGPWKLLHPGKDREGYRRVDLYDGDGGVCTRKVCGLILTAFVRERLAGQEARHLDGDQGNDSLGNLAWGTPLENHADKRRHGTVAKGDRHGKAKLTDGQIDAILARKGTATQKVVADEFGVSRGYVGQLWSGNRSRVK